MVNLKTFQFSCDLMWGYRVKIDLDDCTSNDDIVEYGVSLLRSFLDSNNLEVLLVRINELDYHITYDHYKCTLSLIEKAGFRCTVGSPELAEHGSLAGISGPLNLDCVSIIQVGDEEGLNSRKPKEYLFL